MKLTEQTSINHANMNYKLENLICDIDNLRNEYASMVKACEKTYKKIKKNTGAMKLCQSMDIEDDYNHIEWAMSELDEALDLLDQALENFMYPSIMPFVHGYEYLEQHKEK